MTRRRGFSAAPAPRQKSLPSEGYIAESDRGTWSARSPVTVFFAFVKRLRDGYGYAVVEGAGSSGPDLRPSAYRVDSEAHKRS